MGYVSVSRGFQSGGWNLQTPQNPAFGPETLDDFEAGLKYVDRSRRFRADANIFYYDYSDLQVSAITPIGSGDDQRHLGRNLRAGAAARRAAGSRHGRHLRGAGAEDAVQALPQRDLHQFQRRRGRPLCADHLRRHRQPPSLRARVQVQCRCKPPGLAGQGRHFGAERKPGLQFAAISRNPTMSCGRRPSRRSMHRRNGGRGRRGPSVRFWVLNLTDAHYYNSLATVPTAGVLQSPAAPRRFGASIGYRILGRSCDSACRRLHGLGFREKSR